MQKLNFKIKKLPDVLNIYETITIAGPTCCGKTKTAIELARIFNGEIINADKTYFFRGLEIGTGASDIMNSGVPLHLYGILDPDKNKLGPDEYNSKAINAISNIKMRGKLPVIEGNTPGYLLNILEQKDKNRNLVIAFELPVGFNLSDYAKTRINKAFENGLIEETKEALEKGYRDSYIMNKSIVYRAVIKMLDGKQTENATKNEILHEIQRVHYSDLSKLKKMDGINWIISNPENKIKNLLTTLDFLKKASTTCIQRLVA